MKESSLLALNTASHYLQTVFAVVMGVFSGRWLFQALGVVDYGLLGTVGALLAFVTILNAATASSTARFFAIHIGRKDTAGAQEWFNTALLVHLSLATVLTGAGIVTGNWAFQHYFNIPIARLSTARSVFGLSLFGVFATMVATPWIGMFTAKQRIIEMSLWSVARTILNFVFVWWLTFYQGDAWLAYARGTVALSVALITCQAIRAQWIFPECRIKFSAGINGGRILKLTEFVSWIFFATMGDVIRKQGTNILLNRKFHPDTHPDVNASYSIGMRLSGYTQLFTQSLHTAATPEISSSEGRHDRARAIELANRVSKFAVCSTLILAVPLLVEADYLLALWLGNPPAFASTFVRFFILADLMDRLPMGQSLAVLASGRLGGQQVCKGVLRMATIPLCWVLFQAGFSATSCGWVYCALSMLCICSDVLWANAVIGMSARVWSRIVLAPCLAVAAVSTGLGFAVFALANEFHPLARLILVSTAGIAGVVLSCATFAFDRREKAFVAGFAKKALSQLKAVILAGRSLASSIDETGTSS